MLDTLTPLKVLTSAQIDQFIDQGYAHLSNAFDPEAATVVRNRVWDLLEEKNPTVKRNDRSTWNRRYIHLPHSIEGPAAEACFTPQLYAAYDDVLGEGRWNPMSAVGWWPILFPGFDVAPWREPQDGWHIDGIQFHHHLNSPDQGLLTIFLFSDLGVGDGGTCFDAESHKLTARILADSEPEGLDCNELGRRVRTHPRKKVVEAVGKAGDVLLLHPFMNHTAGYNIGNSVRFLCNPCISLKEPMNLNREDGAYSPVETAIRRALQD